MLEKLPCHISGFPQVYLVHNPVDVKQALRRNRWRDLVEDKSGKTASIENSLRWEHKGLKEWGCAKSGG